MHRLRGFARALLVLVACASPAAAADGGNVQVRVVGPSGKAVKDVPVLVRVKAWPGNRLQLRDHEGRTDAKGRATLESVVPAGTRYGVYASSAAPGHTLVSVYRWSGAPAPMEPIELAVQPAHPLRLRCVDADGKPVSGVRVAPAMRHTADGAHHLLAAAPRDVVVATSGSDGVVSLPYFLAGEWVGALVAWPGQAWQQRSFTVPAAKDALVDVGPQEPTTQDVELTAGGDARKRFFFTGPKGGDVEPKDGWGLLLVLPGGDGGEGFRAWVRAHYDDWVGAGFVQAQLVAPAWTPTQDVVWPIAPSPADGRTFSTEEFVASVVETVAGKVKLDRRRVLAVGWSSSGPALWRLLSLEDAPVRGYVIAMSVFHPQSLDSLAHAKGRQVALLHSPTDDRCPLALAEKGRDALRKAGGTAEWATYEGGHGWEGESEALVARALAKMSAALAAGR